MKKLIIAALLLVCSVASAQDIKLPKVNLTQASMTVDKALMTRHSVRSYASTKLTLQQIGNVCWAACGQQRDDKHITSPTAMNRQEIRLYVFTDAAVYEYDVKNHRLLFRVKGDHRGLLAAGQDFAKTAPISLLMVIDFDKYGSMNDIAVNMTCVDAGIVTQNINLYCQAAGLATVTRGMMDTKAVSQLLKLTSKQLPILNNPVGIEK